MIGLASAVFDGALHDCRRIEPHGVVTRLEEARGTRLVLDGDAEAGHEVAQLLLLDDLRVEREALLACGGLVVLRRAQEQAVQTGEQRGEEQVATRRLGARRGERQQLRAEPIHQRLHGVAHGWLVLREAGELGEERLGAAEAQVLVRVARHLDKEIHKFGRSRLDRSQCGNELVGFECEELAAEGGAVAFAATSDLKEEPADVLAESLRGN